VANPIRIMIADDHTMFREGLRKLLEFSPSFEIVGEARDGMGTRGWDPEIPEPGAAMAWK
jgi:DNA-binding NarL/FixJ family response regulator